MLFIQDLPLGLDGRPEGDPARDLLRRAVERPRVREDEDRRSSTTRAATTTCSRRYAGRAAACRCRTLLRRADVRHPLPLDGHLLLAEPDRREPRDDVPAHRRARAADRAVPRLRPRPVPGHLAGTAGLDPGRLHRQPTAIRIRRQRPAASTTSATPSRSTIDAYHGTTTFHLLDPNDPIAQTLGEDLPGPAPAARATMPEDLRTRLRYPHGIFALQAAMFATFHMTEPGGLLQPGGPVGDPRVRQWAGSRRRWSPTTRS